MGNSTANKNVFKDGLMVGQELVLFAAGAGWVFIFSYLSVLAYLSNSAPSVETATWMTEPLNL